MLALSGIQKRYGGIIALAGADLHCGAGEVHGLVGENGAGKSTIVKVLAGAIARDVGTVELRGRATNLTSPSAAIRSGIGVAHQELSLPGDITVADALLCQRYAAGRTRSARDAHAAAQELLDRFGVQGISPRDTVSNLPLPQRSVIEIVKAAATEPDVLVLDEPTSALGPGETRWLIDLVRRHTAQGGAALFISHRLREITELCDRVTVFRNGRSVYAAGMRDTNADRLVAEMSGRTVGRLYPERTRREAGAPRLVIKGLHVARAVQDVDLTVAAGEIVGVGGLVGHGQHELLLGLAGILVPQGGLLLDGLDYRPRTPADAIRRGVALVPSDRPRAGVFAKRSVAENLLVSVLDKIARGGVIRRDAERAVVARSFETLRIKAESPKVAIDTLSGGNQQKVIFARLIETCPKVLLLADSTRGVDVGTKAEIYQLVRSFAAAGGTVVFHSSDIEELLGVADRVLVMRAGRVVATLLGNALNEDNILRASLGEAVKQ